MQAQWHGKTYKAHAPTCAGGLIRRGHLMTGERVVRPSTGKAHVYCRCTVSRPGDRPPAPE